MCFGNGVRDVVAVPSAGSFCCALAGSHCRNCPRQSQQLRHSFGSPQQCDRPLGTITCAVMDQHIM
jgi:hypothetical protein